MESDLHMVSFRIINFSFDLRDEVFGSAVVYRFDGLGEGRYLIETVRARLLNPG